MAYTNGPPTIVTDGLVLYMDTMNPRSYVSGSTIWTDIISSNVTASNFRRVVDGSSYIGNPLVVSSSAGVGGTSGIMFEDSSSKPDIYFDSRASRFTLSVWASVIHLNPEFGSMNRGILARGSNQGGFGGYVGIAAGKLNTESAVTVSVGTRGTSQAPSITLSNGVRTGSVTSAEIFNAVLVYDSSSMYGYFNGNYSGTAVTAVETQFFTGSPWRCNAYGASDGNGGGGSMSIYIAQIYNRALSAQEVQRNFNATRGRFGL